MRWPWRRRRAQPGGPAKQALQRAQDELQRTTEQRPKVEEVTRRAYDVVSQTGRFTRDVDRALRLRENP